MAPSTVPDDVGRPACRSALKRLTHGTKSGELSAPFGHGHKLRPRLIVERFSKNACEAFLPLRHPCAVMLADHFLRIAEKFRNISDRHTRLLQENAREGMTEAVGCRLFFPRAAQVPDFV